MLGAFPIIFNGVWSILSVNIPIANNINFTLWQFFMFIIIVGILLKQLFKNSTSGGAD